MSDCDFLNNTENGQNHFESIHDKLDKLDESIRGNGKVGIMIRMDRLEQTAKRQAKLIWLLLGSVGAGITTAIAILITG